MAMDHDIEKRFDKIDDELREIKGSLITVIRLDERQRSHSQSIQSQGKRIGNLEKDFHSIEKSHWKTLLLLI